MTLWDRIGGTYRVPKEDSFVQSLRKESQQAQDYKKLD